MKTKNTISILNIFLKIFDFNQRKINKLIEQEILSGGNFEKLIFPIDELNQLHVIQFFKNNNIYGIVSGLGADKDLKLAYLKSIVEYFERLAFFKNEKNLNLFSTNGIAAHRIPAIAKNSAEDELLERDSFLRHWYSNTPFTPLLLNSEEEHINQSLKSESLEIFLGQTYLGFKETTACFLKSNKTNGFALGISSGRGFYDREKAIQEALINYFFGHLGVPVENQLLAIQNEGVRSLQSHRAYWLYLNPMPSWIFAAGTTKKAVKSKLISKSQFQSLENSPFKVYRCINQELIELLIGDVCKIYPDALTQIGFNVVLGPTQFHPIP